MDNVLTLEQISSDHEVRVYLQTADENFAAIGYKEHGPRHAQLSGNIAGNVLKFLDYPERDQELARVAGYLHDIGNAVSHDDHAQNGAILALEILDRLKAPYADIFPVISAIGSHEDRNIDPPSAIAAAVILGDKTDVNCARVRTKSAASLDMHDRVNQACQRAFLRVNREPRTISLELTIDTAVCPLMEYFEIFLARTKFCRKASRALGCEFELYINKDKFL
ncbi:MAG: HD domain-containing protein [Endomicrobiales bacterium]